MAIGGSAVNLNRAGPVIDYTSLDFIAAKQDFIVYAQSTYADRWTDFNPDQFAVVFLDLQAYQTDLLTFYLNTALREVTVAHAQRRQHLVEIARTLDYQLASAAAASGELELVSQAANLPITVLSTSQFSAGDVIFQPDQNYTLTTGNGDNNGDGTYTHEIGAVEGQQFTDSALGTSNGAREQNYLLPQSPLIDGTLTVKVNGVAWTAVTSFTTSEPSSTHYRVETNDANETTIHFGDGVNGKIPPTGQDITGTWKVGGGRRGNVGAETVTTIVSAITGVVSVTNPAAMTGGENKETINAARAAIPKSLSAGDRAVTAEDYATLAKAASASVAKASAREVVTDARLIAVTIAPAGGGFANDTLKGEVSTYLNQRRMVGRRIRIDDPFYVDCLVEVDLFIDPTVNRDVLTAQVSELFRTSSSSDVQDGLFDFPNVGFGAANDQGDLQLTLSEVYALLRTLRPKGLNRSFIRQLTTKPALKASSIVGSEDYALAFTTANSQLLVRRRFRLAFTSGTTYEVYERVVGSSTSLSTTILTDDRQVFAADQIGRLLNPNDRQSSAFTISAASGSQLTITGGDLFTVGAKGDRFFTEPSTPSATGTVGVSFTTFLATQGWSWAVNGTGFANGDEFFVDVYPQASDLVLGSDEIPQIAAADIILNARTAG